MGLSLTTADLRQLEAAQHALLAPVEAPDPAEWQLRANRAIRRFLGADHSAFSLPTDTVPEVVSDDTDPAFPERFHRYCIGVFSGEYRFRDPLIQKAVAVRRAGGTGAYHERMFCDRQEAERSVSYNELFRPVGLTDMIGLSTPLPVGEATQFFSFDGPDAEEASQAALERLRLLVPAFEAGVRTHRRLAARRATLSALLDRLHQALAVYSTEGQRLHCNPLLETLLAEEPGVDEVQGTLDAVARSLTGRWKSSRKSADAPVPTEVSRRVRTKRAEYRLVGSYLPPDFLEDGGVLVLVDRVRPILPGKRRLRAGFGLTKREAEIALLLAEGLTDSAIAERLSISPHTARRHSERVLKKLDVHSRAAVALRLLRAKR